MLQRGTKTEDITCTTLCTSIEQLGREIVNILPFGLVLVKGDASIGSRALIHCTQQCDLSRNIIKNNINLIFVEGKLLDFPNKEFCIPLPTSVSTAKKRLWLEVDSKKVLAWPLSGMLGYIVENKFRSLSIVRPDVVRQIRSNLFQQMSRKEESVKTGHNTSFGVTIAVYKNEATPTVSKYKDDKDVSKILLYQFPDGNSKEKTYHFLDHSHIDVMQWAYSHSDGLLSNLSFKDFESILRFKLPKMKKTYVVGKVVFILCENETDISKYFEVKKKKTSLINVIFYKLS